MHYLTPDAAAGVILCRRLRFDAAIAHVITGLLNTLIYPAAWEQSETGIPVDDTLLLVREMWEQYLNGGDTCMIGSVVAYATTTPPYGILPCDGGTYLRADYPTLYDMLEPMYQTTATTFTTPDLRGRILVGDGSGIGLTPRAIGDTGGVEVHTLTVTELPSHNHSEQNPGTVLITPGVDPIFQALADPGLPGVTGSTGGGGAHENMPPFAVLHYGIVAL